MAPTTDNPVASAAWAGVQLIDGFRLWVNGGVVHTAPSTQRLLAHLALHEEPVTRAAAAALLWPDTTRRRAASCLRSTLWRLVKPPHPVVDMVEDALRIAPGIPVDVVVVRRMADGADVCTEPPVALLAAELLPGWSEPWLEVERDWFGQVRLRVLEMLSERYRNRGEHLQAYHAAMAAVHADPLRESAHRQLVQLHLREGNPAAAMRQFTSYRLRLRKELGLVPSAEIRRLVQPLLGR